MIYSQFQVNLTHKFLSCIYITALHWDPVHYEQCRHKSHVCLLVFFFVDLYRVSYIVLKHPVVHKENRVFPLIGASRWCSSTNYKSFYTDQWNYFNILSTLFNTLRPRQNRRHLPDDIFICIFLNENVWISIKISLKFAPKGPINNTAALVQIMAWRRSGDKPLSESMMVNFPTHICVTRPQWASGQSKCVG